MVSIRRRIRTNLAIIVKNLKEERNSSHIDDHVRLIAEKCR